MRLVFPAMRARVTHMSWPKAGTSGHQTARKPRSSARSAYSTVRGPGGSRKSWVSMGRSRDKWFLRSRRFCHRRQRGAPHEIDKTEHVGWFLIATPGDMLVRTHQHEPVAVELQCLARSHVENGKR